MPPSGGRSPARYRAVQQLADGREAGRPVVSSGAGKPAAATGDQFPVPGQRQAVNCMPLAGLPQVAGRAGIRPVLRYPQRWQVITRYRAVQQLADSREPGTALRLAGRQAGGLIPCREVSSGNGRPAPGTRVNAGLF